MRSVLVCLALMMGGCTVIPENIQLPEETQLVSYEQAAVNVDTSISKSARWGGLIAEVHNTADGTFVEVVHFPLNHYGKPNVNNETVGRFKVKMDGFLDPVVFENGRTITFIGKVDAPTPGFVGEQPYIYPTLDGDSFHLWRKERVYDVRTTQFNNFGWWGPGWGPMWAGGWGPMWGPAWGGGFWGGPFMRPGFGYGPWGWGNGFQRSRIRVIERAPRANPNSSVNYGIRAVSPTTRVYHGTQPAPRARVK